MSAGGSSGSADSTFERTGTVETRSYRNLGEAHRDRFRDLIGVLRPQRGADNVDPMLSHVMTLHRNDIPMRDELRRVIYSNLPSNPVLGGNTSLGRQAAVDPFSDGYANNTFNRYQYDVGNALAAQRSGPAATMGGTAAQGFMMSDLMDRMSMNREQVLAANRGQDAQISQGASQVMGGIRNSMDQAALAGIGLSSQDFSRLMSTKMGAAGLTNDRLNLYGQVVPTFASLATPMIGEEINNLAGRGAQTSSSFGGGVNLCCFIFMEAYHGKMPWYVRACRDEFAPESSRRRNGYIRMSKWLVPLMRVNGFSRKVTNRLLIQPLTRWGAWHMSCREKVSLVDRLAKNFWFGFWTLTGK